MKNVSLKEKLLALCIRHVEEKINSAAEAMRSAQEAANEEGKSSAATNTKPGVR